MPSPNRFGVPMNDSPTSPMSEPTTVPEIIVDQNGLVLVADEHVAAIAELFAGEPVNFGGRDIKKAVRFVPASTVSALRTQLDNARDRIEELERHGEDVAAEFEKECWVAMRSLLNQCGFNWNDETCTAADAREYISETLKEQKRQLEEARADHLRISELLTAAVDDYNDALAQIARLKEALRPIRDLNINDAELLRIRNDAEHNEHVATWGRMLQKLVDAIRECRALAQPKGEADVG